MTKILETADEQVVLDVYAIQNDMCNSTVNGQPRIGCKKIGGVFVPINQLPGWKDEVDAEGNPLPLDKHSKWVGIKDTYPIETDADGVTKRLELHDEIVAEIETAKAKPANERTDKEKKLAKAVIKDKATVKDKPAKG